MGIILVLSVLLSLIAGYLLARAKLYLEIAEARSLKEERLFLVNIINEAADLTRDMMIDDSVPNSYRGTAAFLKGQIELVRGRHFEMEELPSAD